MLSFRWQLDGLARLASRDVRGRVVLTVGIAVGGADGDLDSMA